MKSKENRDEEIGNSDIGVHVIEFFQVHSDHLFRGVYSLDWYTSKWRFPKNKKCLIRDERDMDLIIIKKFKFV